jgi:fumarylpyruvate hydrolase
MDHLVIPAPPTVTLPVAGGSRFPIRRILCVGRNYADHAREMGGDPSREPPFFFSKPADSVVTSGDPTPYPPVTTDLHHEMELVIAIGTGGAGIAVSAATGHIYGYAAGLDMTRRDLQAEAKKAGRPWDMAKGFDHSAPIGMIAPCSVIGHPTKGALTLSVNGTVRQRADIADMIWSVPEIVSHLSHLIALAPGDLIMTGTPAGVAAVVRGDRLDGQIAGIGTVSTVIA